MLKAKIVLPKHFWIFVLPIFLVVGLVAWQRRCPEHLFVSIGNFDEEPKGNLDLERLSAELNRCTGAKSVTVLYRVTQGDTAGERTLSFERTKAGRGVLLSEVKSLDPAVNTGGTNGGGETCESNIHLWAETATIKRQDGENYYPLSQENFACP